MKKIYFYFSVILISFCLLTTTILANPYPSVVGESAILIDRKTGTVLYEKNSNIRMYPASTTKILTSILCIENLNTSDVMSKTSNSVNNVPSNSSHIGLSVGDNFSVLDGIYAVMLGSDNYVSHDLALYLDNSIPKFANRMNQKAKEIGAYNSNFVNPHGYHNPNHYTTAKDLALIANYAFDNSTFRQIASSQNHTLKRYNRPNNPIYFEHTVQLLNPKSAFYNSNSIGGKTGFHTPAGRCLVAAANKDDMEIIGVVLKSNSYNFFNDMNLLFDYGFKNFSLEQDENGYYVSNNSYSKWAKDIVNISIYNGFIDKYNTANYKAPISSKDFVELLIKATYLSHNNDLTGFSKEDVSSTALDLKLIDSDSLLSGFYNPIKREEAAYILDKLLNSLNYKPCTIYPINVYKDHGATNPDYLQSIYDLQQTGLMGNPKGEFFNPRDNLTFEEALSIVTRFYNLYSNSLYSYINAKHIA